MAKALASRPLVGLFAVAFGLLRAPNKPEKSKPELPSWFKGPENRSLLYVTFHRSLTISDGPISVSPQAGHTREALEEFLEITVSLPEGEAQTTVGVGSF